MPSVMAVKVRKAANQRHVEALHRHVDDRLKKPKKLRARASLAHAEHRSWATRYIKHVAETLGYFDVTLREGMPLLERHYGLIVPELSDGTLRSKKAIALAEAVQAKTGIALP